MNTLLKNHFLLLAVLVITGCVARGYENTSRVPVKVLTKSDIHGVRVETKEGSRVVTRKGGNTDRRTAQTVKPVGATVHDKLMSQYREWRGVPYKFGGSTKRGIDCSGFVHTTFRSKFGVEIPRSTELLSRAGVDIGRSHLKTGDLVFFKTGYKVRHVGVYLSRGNFMHASTSRGVMISNLSNVYWTKKYWKAKRLVF